MGRIVLAAKYFGGSDFEELYQEAITRALEGHRTCRRGVSVVAFICGVMKSLVSQEREAVKAGMRAVAVGEDALPEVDVNAVQDSPLDRLIERERHEESQQLIADDEQLQLLVEGICDDLRGQELEELLGVDAKGLAAARKRLKRRLSSRSSGGTAS